VELHVALALHCSARAAHDSARTWARIRASFCIRTRARARLCVRAGTCIRSRATP
jgi:hypothetical protein